MCVNLLEKVVKFFTFFQVLPQKSIQRKASGLTFTIYLPLGRYDSEKIDDINNFYESLGMQNVDKFPLIDAGTVCNALMCGLMVFDKKQSNSL